LNAENWLFCLVTVTQFETFALFFGIIPNLSEPYKYMKTPDQTGHKRKASMERNGEIGAQNAQNFPVAEPNSVFHGSFSLNISVACLAKNFESS